MKRITLITLSVMALALGSTGSAAAQDLSSVYVTPKILLSNQTGDMAASQWSEGNGWFQTVPGGSQDDTSFGLGVAVGADLSYSTAYPIRVEAEYLYHGKQTFNNGPHLVANRLVSQTYDVSAHSFMANGFFDISTATAFTPYVGGGLGLAYVKSDFNSIFSNGDRVSVTNDSGKWNFAWNIGGGVAWSLNETMALDLGYRYMDLGRGDSGDFTVGGHSGQASVDLTAHEFGLGLRFTGF